LKGRRPLRAPAYPQPVVYAVRLCVATPAGITLAAVYPTGVPLSPLPILEDFCVAFDNRTSAALSLLLDPSLKNMKL